MIVQGLSVTDDHLLSADLLGGAARANYIYSVRVGKGSADGDAGEGIDHAGVGGVIRGVGIKAGEQMQVGGTDDLGGCFAEPSALLVDAGIDLDEMYAWQVSGFALSGDSPVDIELRLFAAVGMVVDITPGVGILHIVGARAGQIFVVIGKSCAGKCQAVGIDPCGEGAGRGAVIGEGIAVDGERVGIFRACQLVPLVVGLSVAVGIVADEHYAGFARTAGTAVLLCAGRGIESIAEHDEIVLSGDVLNHVVEPENDISSPSAEADHAAVVIGDSFLSFHAHGFGIVTGFVFRQRVDKLPRSRQKIPYMRYVWRLSLAN